MRSFLKSWSPCLLSVLRMVSALLFVEHGSSKLLDFPHDAMAHSVTLHSLAGLSGMLELVGGLLLLVGLFTRFTAFILSGEMAVAYFMAHAPHGLYPLLNKGELAVLYCFVFLFLVFAGPGPLSLDRLRHRD